MAATHSDRKSRRTLIPDRWDLTDLVKDPLRQLEAHLSAIEVQVTQIESARATLSPALSDNDFASILTLSESVAQSASRLGAYAYLWFSENTGDIKARSFKTNVEERLTVFKTVCCFSSFGGRASMRQNAAALDGRTRVMSDITWKPFADINLIRCPSLKKRSSMSRTSRAEAPSTRSTTS